MCNHNVCNTEAEFIYRNVNFETTKISQFYKLEFRRYGTDIVKVFLRHCIVTSHKNNIVPEPYLLLHHFSKTWYQEGITRQTRTNFEGEREKLQFH
jgi:hypothetical protein